jgi:hypothetical protein
VTVRVAVTVRVGASVRVAVTARVYQAPKGKLRPVVPAAKLEALNSLIIWPLRAISADRLTT